MVKRVLRKNTSDNQTDLLNAALDLVEKVARSLRKMKFVSVRSVDKGSSVNLFTDRIEF